MSNLKQQSYQLRFAPENMENSGLEAFFIDLFLHTSVPLSLADSSSVNIIVTNNPASAAADRFKIVFRPLSALPSTFISVKAYKKNKEIAVEWKVENETNLSGYEMQKSTDGIKFTKCATVVAGNKGYGSYQWIDKQPVSGYNFYRIMSVGQDNKTEYSTVMKILVDDQKPSLSVYPNPVTNGVINLQFTNQPGGIYSLRLLNVSGQVIASKQIIHNGNNQTENIKWDHKLARGVYDLEVTKPAGETEIIKVMYQ